MEDEYAAEDDGEPSSARANAEQYLPPGMAQKKASPFMKYMPYGVAAIVLVVLGFLGYQQLQTMTGGFGQDAKNGSAMTPPPMAQNPAVPEAPGPMENSIPSTEPLNSNNPSAGMPPQTAQAQNAPQNNQPMPLGAPPQAQPPAPAATTTTATATQGQDYILNPDGTKSPVTPPTPVVTASTPVTPAPATLPSPAENSALANQLAAVTHQLDEMKKNQAQLEEQLQAAKNAPPAPSADLKPLQDKIAELEQRLAAKEAAKVEEPKAAPVKHKKTSVIAKPSDGSVEDLPPPASETKWAKASSRTKASRRDKNASTGSEASRLQREMNARYAGAPMNEMSPQGMPNNGGPLPTGPYGQMPMNAGPMPGAPPAWGDQGAPMAVNAAGGGWILRSAQPGSAWLSQGMSSDLTRVIPGDKLPGLGTIVSVRMVAGRWLVEGTQGSVR